MAKETITTTHEVTPIGADGVCLPPDPALSYTRTIERTIADGKTVIHRIADSREDVDDRGPDAKKPDKAKKD